MRERYKYTYIHRESVSIKSSKFDSIRALDASRKAHDGNRTEDDESMHSI